tara:strand:+ start:1146 stop:1586 length:441 start_codon:yes stop_codon:yes gene_type:complete
MRDFQKGDVVIVTSNTSLYFGLEGVVVRVNGESVSVKFPDVMHLKTYKSKNLRLSKVVKCKPEKHTVIIFDRTDDYDEAKDIVRSFKDITFHDCSIVHIEGSYDVIDHPEITEQLSQHNHLCVFFPEHDGTKLAVLSHKVQTMYIG